MDLARLESKLDHLETELTYLNHLLINAGFMNGVETLKETIEQMISDNSLIE